MLMCVAMCRVRLPLVVNDAVHTLQLNALTPVTTETRSVTAPRCRSIVGRRKRQKRIRPRSHKSKDHLPARGLFWEGDAACLTTNVLVALKRCSKQTPSSLCPSLPVFDSPAGDKSCIAP